jgi:class 3 adenylate cyclase
MSARERAFALRLEAEAARIAAAAQGGEVLASWHSAQACKFTLSEPREVNLKGIAQPVQVVSVSRR